MRIRHPRYLVVSLACALGLSAGCASLGPLAALVRAPQFEEAPDQRAEIRWLPPSTAQPLGGAGVRLWAQVTNPNAFGVTLSRLDGQLFLEDARAVEVNLPLGLPLEPRGMTTFPIDLRLSLADLPGLADAIRNASNREAIAYRLDATVGVAAGRFGQPEFGPMTILRGALRVALPAQPSGFSTFRP